MDSVLEARLDKEFKVMKNRFVRINSEFYVGGKYDMFTGKTLGQIKFMILCLCIADNRVQIYTEGNANDKPLPTRINIIVNESELKVFRSLYDKNIKTFKSINKVIDCQCNGIPVFWSSETEEGGVFISVSLDIIKYHEDKNYSNVWVGDVLSTTSISSMLLKFKAYPFLRVQSFVEGGQTDSFEDLKKVKLIISSYDFQSWTNCKDKITQSLRRALASMDKENGIKIECKAFYDKKLVVQLDTVNLAKNIKSNGEKIEARHSNKSNKNPRELDLRRD